jgi:hypothetical protein
MEKQLINKDVTEVDLKKSFDALLDFEIELKEECKRIIAFEIQDGKISKLSHYIYSIVNRVISLNRGFITLADSRNYLCAISLLRLQVDSYMRFYAMTLVDNVPNVYDSILSGIELRDIKDCDGKKMTDSYLANKIDKIYPGFLNLYKNTCGFIHFSNKHLFANNEITKINSDEITISTSIGAPDNYTIIQKVDYTYNMLFVSKCIYRLIKEYRVEIEKININNEFDK